MFQRLAACSIILFMATPSEAITYDISCKFYLARPDSPTTLPLVAEKSAQLAEGFDSFPRNVMETSFEAPEGEVTIRITAHSNASNANKKWPEKYLVSTVWLERPKPDGSTYLRHMGGTLNMSMGRSSGSLRLGYSEDASFVHYTCDIENKAL